MDSALDTADQQRLEGYFHLFAITFLYWDHLITMNPEVEYLWKRPVSVSRYLFFLNRYFAVLGNIVITVSLFSNDLNASLLYYSSTPLLTLLYTEVCTKFLRRVHHNRPKRMHLGLNFHSCPTFHLFRELLLVLTQVIVCLLLTLRIYALYACSKRILTFMLSTACTLAGLSCFAIFFGQSSESEVTSSGCHTLLNRVTGIQVAAAWEALFLYDSMLFGMTLFKAYKTRHELRLERQRVSLLALVLRDGSIYFAVMALANLTNILTFYFPFPYLRGALSTFASGVSVTMMSRLMLNLHEIADTGLYTSHRTTITGPLGSPPTHAGRAPRHYFTSALDTNHDIYNSEFNP